MEVTSKNNESTVVKLDPTRAFQFDIVKVIHDLIDNKSDFYHINVTENSIVVEKQGYNTATIQSVTFDTTELVNDEYFTQTADAIFAAYQYTFGKTGDLNSRVGVIRDRSIADSHLGSSHAFYHDRTGKYPEETIVSRITLRGEEPQTGRGRK